MEIVRHGGPQPLHPDDLPPQVLLIDGNDYFVLTVWWARQNGIPAPVRVQLVSISVINGDRREITAKLFRKLMVMRNIEATRLQLNIQPWSP